MSVRKPQTPGLFNHFIRTTPRLRVDGRLQMGSATFRCWSPKEAAELARALRSRTVFARHSGERDLYATKAEQFASNSGLEIILPGGHKLTADAIRQLGDEHERLLFLAAAYGHTRGAIHKALGVSKYGHEDEALDLLISAGMKHVSTRTKRRGTRRGLAVDSRTQRRATFLGLTQGVIGALVEPSNEIARRARDALSWIEQSVLEWDDASATVKCSMGFETLLVFNEGEPVGRSIAERLAFLLGETADERAALARALGRFYELRSAIVHGDVSRVVKARTRTDPEKMRRLLMLASMCIASHASVMPSRENMRVWFEGLRWSTSTPAPAVPFRRSLLRKLLV